MKFKKGKRGRKEDKKAKEKDKEKTPQKIEPILGEEKPVDKSQEKRDKEITAIPKKEGIKKGVNQVMAKARFLRISPRKVRLVIDVIRGMKTEEALEKLQFINKKATRFIIKLLNSALANAEHNYKLNKEDLYIKKIVANEGPTLHRWQARAFGRASEIRKRTTHLEVVLATKEGLKEKAEEKVKVEKKVKKVKEPKAEKKKEVVKEKPKKEKKVEKKSKEIEKEESVI